MALVLTRPGTRTSLLAAMFIGLPLCELASFAVVWNTVAAAAFGAAAGAAAWLLFIWPAERETAFNSTGTADPFDRMFESSVLAWTARAGLTLCLLAGFQLVAVAVEFLLKPDHEMPARGNFLTPVYRTMAIPAVAKLLTGIWIALALAGSLRSLPIIATSIRFFNHVVFYLLIGTLLLFRHALPFLTREPLEWPTYDIGPLWLYFSTASLAAPVINFMWGTPNCGAPWRGTIFSAALAVGIGCLIPAASLRALRMQRIGVTGSIEFLSAVGIFHGSDPIRAGKGILLSLAFFGWAQVAFLVLRGIWAGRVSQIRLPMAILGLLVWRPWLDAAQDNWYWSVEAAVGVATLLSVLAGIIAGRAFVTAVMRSRVPADLRVPERIAALAGVVFAAWAVVRPNAVLDVAPFCASLVLMVSISAMGPFGRRSGNSPGA